MLLNIFKSKSPIVLGFIIFISLSLWLKTFLGESIPLLSDSSMPLYELLLHTITTSNLQLSIALVVYLLQLVYLLNFSNNYKILEENFFLHLLIYSLIVSSVTFLQHLLPIYVASLLFMMAINQILKSLNIDNAIPNYFEAAFLISLSSLFYFNIIFYFPIVWISLFIIRPIIWREWFISLVGLFLPYLFVSSYYFVFGNHEFIWFLALIENASFEHSKFEFNFISTIIVLFSLSISLLQILKKKSLTISNRKIKTLFIWIIAITFFIYFIIDSNALQLIFIFGFINTFFITNYLTELKRKWIANIILLIFIGINVYVQFF